MRTTYLSVMAAGLLLVIARPGESGQRAGGGTSPVPRTEAAELRSLVDGVVGGKPAGGDAYLKWDGHFMRAADGRVYVPFTLRLDEADASFESIAMYVRVVPRGTKSPAGDRHVSGSVLGTPVSAPESQFSRGNPTAGEASARLGLMASELSAVKPSFEAYFVARVPGKPAPRILRRALVVVPGEHDLYVAVRERPGAATGGGPKAAVLQRTLIVPNLEGSEPTMSSIVLASRVDALATRVSSSTREDRPYAFGSAEVFPDADSTFNQDDVLSVVYFVYNLAVDEGKLPDVTVECRFFRMSVWGKVFGELAPQRFGRAHAAPAFDLKAGRQLAVTQAVPLTTFPPDTYELEIVVTDNLAGVATRRMVRFIVEG